MPASQLLHSLAPEPDDLPATHEMHAAALTFDHVPPSHLVHALLAGSENVPLPHATHEPAPVFEYVPPTQLEQLRERAGE